MEGTARIWFTPRQRAELWERQLERFAQPIAFCPTVSHPADFRCPMTSLELIALIWSTA